MEGQDQDAYNVEGQDQDAYDMEGQDRDAYKGQDNAYGEGQDAYGRRKR